MKPVMFPENCDGERAREEKPIGKVCYDEEESRERSGDEHDSQERCPYAEPDKGTLRVVASSFHDFGNHHEREEDGAEYRKEDRETNHGNP